MSTPDGYPKWDQFARERFEAENWVEKHLTDYPQTRDERIRDEYTPDRSSGEDDE